MASERSEYEKLGVDPGKGAVRKAFGEIVNNDFPRAFCNIVRYPGRPGWVRTKHADGDGSKFVQRLLHYKETGDEEIFQGIVDDAFSMNTGDVAAAGFVSDAEFEFSDIIAINAINVPKDLVMRQIILRIRTLLELYGEYGFCFDFFGGETADLPDQVQTMVFDMDIRAAAREENIIKGNVEIGDSIFGFASHGRAVWERRYNSGIGSNGLTLARICLMHSDYAKKYPFLCRPDKPYRGEFRVEAAPVEFGGLTISEAILSPTRQYALVIDLLIKELKERNGFHLLHGISMNTGGGATKVRNLGKGICYVKNMPDPPPLFYLLKKVTGESWMNMHKIFNCGVGIDVIGSPEDGVLEAAEKAVSEKIRVGCFFLGKCEKPDGDSRGFL